MEILGLAFFYIVAMLSIHAIASVSRTPQSFASTTIKKVTIIVPFRNEEKTLPNLLSSLSNLLNSEGHHLIQAVLFINDHSSDDSCRLIEDAILKSNTNIEILNLAEGKTGKKQALLHAQQQVKHHRIWQVDADTQLSLAALRFHAFQPDDTIGLGAVALTGSRDVYTDFSLVENSLTQMVTAFGAFTGKPLMANGCSLSYPVSILKILNYNLNYSSGDDADLLQCAIRLGYKFSYDFKSRVLVSLEYLNLSQFAMQKARWISKSTSFMHAGHYFLSLTVLLRTLLFVIALVNLSSPAIMAFVTVLLIELVLIYTWSTLLGQRFNAYMSTLYLLLLPAMVVAIPLYAFVFKQQITWKGRPITNSTF